MIVHRYPSFLFTLGAFLSYQSLSCSAFFTAVLSKNKGFNEILIRSSLLGQSTQYADGTLKPFKSMCTQRHVSGKDFIDALVAQNDEDRPLQRYTHMIAIPMETNYDLMLELESIQRAVLYHCPLLINSCIVPALTRMPLLLVDTRSSPLHVLESTRFSSPTPSASSSDLLTSRDPMTRALYTTVQQVISEKINIVVDFSNETHEQRERRIMDSSQGRKGVNEFNVQPLAISFQGLEVDGDDNSVLYAIGKEDDETQRLRGVVTEISTRIREEYGWDVSFPLDLNLEKKQLEQGQGQNDIQCDILWRPRIPFMRLPPNFKQTLPNPKGLDGEWEFYTPEEKANYVRFPEEGGNGISPIFWYQWWEDRFCNGNGIRMKELAVYGRTGPFDISETAFYIPHLKVILPEGNKQLQVDEAKAEKYELGRQDALAQGSEKKEGFQDDSDAALFVKKSEANRRIIETIYASSPGESLVEYERVTEVSNLDHNVNVDMILREKSEVGDATKISADTSKSALKPMETGDSSSRVNPKLKKPKPEDNPIFQQWKDRKTMAYDAPTVPSNKLKRPFPSDEYFVGLWRLVSSPSMVSSGDVESKSNVGSDPSENETLILRVDGTTAGGPIFDPEQKLKSAGGTWRSFQAEWDGKDTDSEKPDEAKQTRLRIRLCVPPKKEKVLVMEGEIRRGPHSSLSSHNFHELQQLSTFSIPQVEAVQQSFNADKLEDAFQIHCIGEMWVEMASSKKGPRKKLGHFTLIKMVDPDPTQIRYSINAK